MPNLSHLPNSAIGTASERIEERIEERIQKVLRNSRHNSRPKPDEEK
ncbi:hypothetical protein [Williamwhitmania taraxaci]|uniref:Uncharacterized protein n=1 Tax=Williamwhitmania taraxaci TaxID=1640674 RepID=A0A1G6NKX7_9BACT|nr:hypothetical protein [Williamwhitmania taraxaci]SDC68301.1 hypothetical protein SAMN05216323_10444 [Williamwhitmania taraxaci]